MTKSLKSGVGNWVDGDRFFNRDVELALLAEHLLDGESISLVAQRRMGKTSLMREVARRLGDRIIPLHVDLEKSHSPEDAIVELGLAAHAHEGFGRRAAQVISGAVDAVIGKIETVKVASLSVTLRSGLTDQNWQTKGDDLCNVLAEASKSSKKPVVIFFDEVPILINRLLRGQDGIITPERKASTDQFMSWLRGNLLTHRGHVIQLLTGSIGLEPVLAQAQLNGTLNAYRSFELRPWKRETAVKCILALAKHKEFPLEGEVAGVMVDLLGSAIPHHVQMFFDHVYRKYRVDEMNGDVSRDFVEQVYNDSMTGVRGHPELSHMEERLKMVLPPESFLEALSMLTEAAATGELSPDTAKRICLAEKNVTEENARAQAGDIINILIHDGYLHQKGDVYHFESTLLRDWWKRRFAQGYKTQAELG